jgi:hypothetical protein
MGPKEIENANNCRSGFQNMQEKVENIEIFASQTSTETSVSSLNVSQASQVSPDSNLGAGPCEKGIASDIMRSKPILPSYVYRLGRHSDLFGCKHCKVTGDKWGWEKHCHGKEEKEINK